MKIAFAHNVYDRLGRLYKTIEIERRLYPDCGIFVSYNNPDFVPNLSRLTGDVGQVYFTERTHKIGCTNGAYHAMKMAYDKGYDVIIFSHDDVYIAHAEEFHKNLMRVALTTTDFIARVPENLPDVGKDYVMMEAMIFSRKGFEQAYGNFKPFRLEEDINRDLRGSISPEAHMHTLAKQIDNKLLIDYVHGNNMIAHNAVFERTMGYHHDNFGLRGWK